MSDSRRTPPAGMPPEQLASLSHELRTPLNGVLGHDAPAGIDPELTAEQKAYGPAPLAESGEHLLGLVNDVLDYARLGVGAIALGEGVIDVENLLRSICELMSPRAREKGIEIGWAVRAGAPTILGDEGRLRQILLNFAGNAVKFVDAGGVLVTAEPVAAGRLRFSVTDTGPGVPEALRAHIFEAFTQIDPGRTVRPAGAGLGLAIARRLADAMGARSGSKTRKGGGRPSGSRPLSPRVPDGPKNGGWAASPTPSPHPVRSFVRRRACRSRGAAGGRSTARLWRRCWRGPGRTMFC